MTKEQKRLYQTAKKARESQKSKINSDNGLIYIIHCIKNKKSFSLKEILIPDKVKIKYVLSVIICCFLAISLALPLKSEDIAIPIVTIIFSICFLIYCYLRLRNNIKNSYKKIISIILSVFIILLLLLFGCMIYYITI